MMSEKTERTPEKFISAFFLCSVGNSRFTTYLSRYIPQIETCTLKDTLIKIKKTLPLINWKSSGACIYQIFVNGIQTKKKITLEIHQHLIKKKTAEKFCSPVSALKPE